MIQPLLTVVETSNLTYLDAGVVGVLLTAIGVLWRRNNQLEDRSHSDTSTAVRALQEAAAALKDVAKTVERMDQGLRDEINDVRGDIKDALRDRAS